MFEKIFFDPFYIQSLQKIALQEGLVTPWLKTTFDDFKLKRNTLRTKTLMCLTLFEEIDGIGYREDFSLQLEELGLFHSHERQNDDYYRKYRSVVEEITGKLFSEFKQKIITDFDQSSPHNFSDYGAKTKVERTAFFDEVFKHVLNQYGVGYEGKLRYLKGQEEIMNTYIYSYLEALYAYISDMVNFSFTEATQFVSKFSSIASGANNFTEPFEDLMCIARTMLNDEIKILPNPKTLKDVMEIRESKEIIRFREVVNEWITVIKTGDAMIEPKIRSDIAKANRDLKNLKKWIEFKNSPIAFWITAIGGHIPIFSNVLTFITTFGDKGYTKWIKHKSNWAMLIQR